MRLATSPLPPAFGSPAPTAWDRPTCCEGSGPAPTPPDPQLQPGPVALVSQSGATAFGPLTTRAVELGLGYSHVVSTGNEADLESSDFIDYLLDEPNVPRGCLLRRGLKGRTEVSGRGEEGSCAWERALP